MNNLEMREEFESAFAKETASKSPPEKLKVFEVHGGFDSLLKQVLFEDRRGNTYATDFYASAWWAWQASRAYVVVKLPDGLVTADGQGVSLDGFRVVAAIEAAGLKVAP